MTKTSGEIRRDDEAPSPRGLLARAALSLGGTEGGDAVFFSRLGYRYETITRLFARLYGGEPGYEKLFGRLEALLLDKYRDRPAALRATDLERESRGPWYLEPGLAAYMVYLDRFAGNLRGFEEKLPYLEELGVKLVHFMPFFPSPEGNNDGGYAVSDYLGVDPRRGTTGDLVQTATLLHERGMYLAADLVLNHSADDHAWALAAKAGDARRRAYYYAFPDRTMPDLFEAGMPEVFPETAPGNFTWVPEMEAWVMTVFHRFQWDLNWSNPELFLEMLGVLLGMANLGIDLLRLDAVPYLWKRPGTSCQNLEEAHDIVRLLKACADVVAPGVAFLAEAIVQPSEIVRYLDSGGVEGEARVEECQLAYHASLMALLWEALATRKTRVFADSFGGETRLPRGTAWLGYARCHDDIGLGYDEGAIARAGFTPALHKRFLLDFYSGRFPGSFATGRLFMENPATGDARISGTCASLAGLESALALRASGDPGGPAAVELALRRIELLHALVASLVGIPMIFSGDELALRNDYSWEGDPELAGDNRWMHRPRMDWEAAERRSRGDTVEGRIFGWIRGCLAARAAIPAFAQDAPFSVPPSPSEQVLLCLRGGAGPGDAPVLVAANFSPEPRALGSPPPGLDASAGLRDLLGGGKVRLDGGQPVLEAYGVAWLADSSFLSRRP
ncbi:MAG: alpha-amylase family protein [Spirochaetaceae bacterium]|nr:alpha-amylase family protein [Spirochaetaceae bacterium]